jgi:hypothetical protein
MVTYVDIGLTFSEILPAMKLIPDKGENTECPGPDPEKFITDPTEPVAQQEWT